jgi:hypothetical protein
MCLYRLNIHLWNNFFRFLFWKKYFLISNPENFFLIVYYINKNSFFFITGICPNFLKIVLHIYYCTLYTTKQKKNYLCTCV